MFDFDRSQGGLRGGAGHHSHQNLVVKPVDFTGHFVPPRWRMGGISGSHVGKKRAVKTCVTHLGRPASKDGLMFIQDVPKTGTQLLEEISPLVFLR